MIGQSQGTALRAVQVIAGKLYVPVREVLTKLCFSGWQAPIRACQLAAQVGGLWKTELIAA